MSKNKKNEDEATERDGLENVYLPTTGETIRAADATDALEKLGHSEEASDSDNEDKNDEGSKE